MSYIDNTRRSFNSAYETTVCITKEECKVLLPFLKNAHKKVKQKHDKYEDIHEGGEATEKQENKRMRYIDELEGLESILSDIDTILKRFELNRCDSTNTKNVAVWRTNVNQY